MAAGGLAALSAFILPSTSHIHIDIDTYTYTQTHKSLYDSLQPDGCHRVYCTRGSSTHRRGGAGGREGGAEGGVGEMGALGLSDSQMLPINFSGRHRAVGESSTCTSQLPTLSLIHI